MEALNINHTGQKYATKLELLEKKLSLILRMRDLTESVELAGDNAEEQYITLVSRREAIIKQLKALDISLSGYAPEDGEDKLLTLISKASEQVLEMDNQLALEVPELMKGIKGRLKRIKNGKSISRAYHSDVLGIIGGRSYALKK